MEKGYTPDQPHSPHDPPSRALGACVLGLEDECKKGNTAIIGDSADFESKPSVLVRFQWLFFSFSDKSRIFCSEDDFVALTTHQIDGPNLTPHIVAEFLTLKTSWVLCYVFAAARETIDAHLANFRMVSSEANVNEHSRLSSPFQVEEASLTRAALELFVCTT